jgi:hypothetical protein
MADPLTNPSAHPAAKRSLWRIFFVRWIRHTFTTENLVNAFKTFAWVGPLTLLIWVWAEREQLHNDSWSIPVEVRSSDRFVSLLEPEDGNVIIDVSGPRAQLDALRQMLTGGLSPRGAMLELDPNLPLGEQYPATAELLNRQPLFRDRGVIVKDASPSRLTVFVDERVTREARIAVSPEVERNLESPPVFDPPITTVSGPKRVLDALPEDADGRLIVTADLSGFPAVQQPGAHELVDVPLLRPVEDPNVALGLTKANVSLRLRQSDVEYTIPSMSIFVIVPPTMMGRYRVVIGDGAFPTIPNVRVSGAPAKIELLKREDFTPRPKALLEVTSEDRPGEIHTRRLRYDLPEGITVHPQDARREIEFRVVERGEGD